jgi:putrescine carbamoyltransferase
VTFVGDTTNVLSSLMHICTRLGMSFTHAAPTKYQPLPAWRAIAEANCQESGGALTITGDVVAAVKEADFIYTDLWWWVGQEDQIPERRAAFMPAYQVNMELLKRAPAHCRFMHCLPASRGVEVTDEVMDSAQSVIFDQSENRLHTEKALLTWFVYPRLRRPSVELGAFHTDRIQAFLSAGP